MKSRKPILVSGGCGFVGRHVVQHAIRNHLTDEIWVVDNLFTGSHPDKWLPAPLQGDKQFASSVRYTGDGVALSFIHRDVRQFFAAYLADPTSYPAFGDVIHLASIVGGRALIDGDPLLVATD